MSIDLRREGLWLLKYGSPEKETLLKQWSAIISNTILVLVRHIVLFMYEPLKCLLDFSLYSDAASHTPNGSNYAQFCATNYRKRPS